MERRNLTFRDFDEVIREVDHLRAVGWDKAGQWDLAQICDHLTFFMEATLDGPTFHVPWLLKVLFGRLALRRILKERRMRSGVFTPQKPLPEPGGDEGAAIRRLKHNIQRLQTHQGEFKDSPFFGHLTPAEWRDLHLIHCAHHLSFLIPKS